MFFDAKRLVDFEEPQRLELGFGGKLRINVFVSAKQQPNGLAVIFIVLRGIGRSSSWISSSGQVTHGTAGLDELRMDRPILYSS